MAITKFVYEKDIPKDSIKDRVLAKLGENTKRSYTVMGLMIDEFEIKESQLDGKSFAQWDSKLNNLYNRVTNALKSLIREGLVSQSKYGQANIYKVKAVKRVSEE